MSAYMRGLRDGIDQACEERDEAQAERDEAIVQRDRARALACRLEEELALIRRAAAARRTHV